MAGPAKGGGKLILPLTADRFPNRDVRRGVVFRIERRQDIVARRHRLAVLTKVPVSSQ
jgi:hypothetical protein